MPEVQFQRRAERDLQDICQTIAIDNQRAAEALYDRIFDKLELAAEQPLMGVARPDLGPNARILVVGHYVVVYRPVKNGILVVAIVHGKRDPDRWLG